MTVLSDKTLLAIWDSSQCTSDDLPLLRAVADAAIAADRARLWKPAGGDYDRSIHHNPDALSWADLFIQTFPNLGANKETMVGWFANAMMAMHDSHPHHTEDNLEMVVPERLKHTPATLTEYDTGYIEGWNACRAALLATQKEPT